MAEAGGPILEGVGRPKEGVVNRVKRAVKEAITKEGRADMYERRYYKKFGSITESLNLTPDQQKALQASVRARMEKAANTNVNRERVGAGVITLLSTIIVGGDIGSAQTKIKDNLRDIKFAVKTGATNMDRKWDMAKHTFSGILSETKGEPRERMSKLWAALMRGGTPFGRT